jgi:hypothetical protein
MRGLEVSICHGKIEWRVGGRYRTWEVLGHERCSHEITRAMTLKLDDM